jgi:RNA polymerase sigma-70 factor (ECF subfamily)
MHDSLLKRRKDRECSSRREKRAESSFGTLGISFNVASFGSSTPKYGVSSKLAAFEISVDFLNLPSGCIRPGTFNHSGISMTDSDASKSADELPQADADASDAPLVGPDPEVLQRLHDEGEQALADAFAAHRERFWYLVTFRIDRRIAARVDADDVLQEAYVAAVKRLTHYLEKPDYSLFVWLRLIVSQTLIDVHRRHLGAEMRSAGREISLGGPKFPQSTSVSLAGQIAMSQTSPSGAAMRDEAAESLATAIQQMSELDQETIALRHFEGLTNSEAAEVLGIGVTAASNRYVRALSRLREILEQIESNQ